MQLRRTTECACVQIGLVAVALTLAASPAALASEEPRPDALWNAFPLEPASEAVPDPANQRPPASPLLPPAQGRSEATTVSDTPPQKSSSNAAIAGRIGYVFLGAGAGILALLELWPELRRAGIDDDQADSIMISLIDALRELHPTA